MCREVIFSEGAEKDVSFRPDLKFRQLRNIRAETPCLKVALRFGARLINSFLISPQRFLSTSAISLLGFVSQFTSSDVVLFARDAKCVAAVQFQ